MSEKTKLSPLFEALFQQWARANDIQADDPAIKYDYRGFWSNPELRSHWKPGDHFPDTYKQHLHPTFSRESQYSQGPYDGGRWDGETYLPQLASSRSSPDPEQLQQSLLNLLEGKD